MGNLAKNKKDKEDEKKDKNNLLFSSSHVWKESLSAVRAFLGNFYYRGWNF